MINLGDRAVGSTLSFDFNTHKSDGTPITLAGTPAISVYKNSTTETTTGVTLTVDYDSRTGMHHVVVDTSDAFYATGNDFSVVITTGTVDSVSVVGTVVAKFSIGRANVSSVNSIAASSVTTINANVGTTQPTNFTGTGATAYVKTDIISAAGTAWTSGAITDPVFAAATYPKAIRTATAQSGAAGYIQLDAGASATNDLYVGCSVKIVGGTGAGQARTIMLYVGSTQRAYVDRVWATNPANDSVFVVNAGKLTADINNVGVATAGGASTITLASTAVATNDYYDGSIVQIISGTGLGQSRIITGYVGSTRVATVADAWATQPDNTSVYMVRGLGDVEVGVNNDKTGYALASTAVNVTQVDGVNLATHASGMMPSDARDILGTAIGTPATAGILDVNVKNINNVVATPFNVAAYPGGMICFNSAAANTNTVLGVDGTPANPVSTPAAAKTLADALGTKRIQVIGTWTNAVTMTGYSFSGNGHTAILDHNGTAMTGCFFEYLDLRGINTGLTNIYSKVTTISTFTVAGVVFDSEIGNNVTINGYTNIWNCQPTNTGAITLNFGATLQAVNIDNLYATYVTIAGLANAGSTVDALFTGYPDIVIDATCTAGTINLMGFIKSITNNGTATVNDRRTAVSIAGTTDANLVSIDGQLTNGNNATLNLKKLNIVNNAGDALVASSTGGNGIGFNISGNGAGDALRAIGGATGHGISAVGGATNGDGLNLSATSGCGARLVGGSDGAGLDSRGAGYGQGSYFEGGATAAGAMVLNNPSSSGNGLLIAATAGDAIKAIGGGTNGSGMSLARGGSGGYDLKGATPSTNLPIDANVVSIDSSAPAAVQLAKSAKTIVSATVNIVDFAPTTTEFETADLTDPAADFYKSRTAIFTTGTLTNQAREIVASSFNVGTGKTHLTVKALTAAPATGVGFNIV